MGKKVVKKTSQKVRSRVFASFVMIVFAMMLLSVRVGWIQIVKGDEYSKKALSYQTRDISIPAKRGAIYDRNGKKLAVSSTTYSVWARPGEIMGDGSRDEQDARIIKTARVLARELDLDRDELENNIRQSKNLIKIAKYIEKEQADEIKEMKIKGISLTEEVKRRYPLGSFLAHVLGSVTDENKGLAGLELKYNRYLSGVSGRWIKTTDAHGNNLVVGTNKYHQAENGLNLVLTIDEVIQHYVEKGISDVQAKTMADRVMCIMMEPKTGDVLAMAMTPDYDPNKPREPFDPAMKETVEAMSVDEKLAYWNSMWRNPMISDTYEPGSTFKLLTTAMALEEQLTNINERFNCKKYYTVAGQPLSCWSPTGHGDQNLVEAVGNSCNPVFATLSQRIGLTKYYEYLDLMGLTEKTGIDYPGEGMAILQSRKTAGPVGLATMAYGQGIAVTPIQLITVISSFGNDGKLMQPRLVKQLVDDDGNVKKEIPPKVVRQVVSKQTAMEMCMIMENVVSKGGGGTAKVAGYRVGGKTGTAQKPKDGKYSEDVYSSFVGMAPMDDPKVAILLIVDNPKGIKFGSQTAAPGVKLILEDTLRYLHIPPEYTLEEEAQLNSGKTKVPMLTDMKFEEAISELGRLSLNYYISPAPAEGEGWINGIVVDQYPKGGEMISNGGTVYLYRDKEAAATDIKDSAGNV